MVTLHLEALALEHIRVENLDCVHHTNDLFSLGISDIETEVFLHGEDKLNAVEAVEAQIFEVRSASEFVVLTFCSALQHLENLALNVLNQLVFVQLG